MPSNKLFLILGFGFDTIPPPTAEFTLSNWIESLVVDHIMALLDGRTPKTTMDFRIIDHWSSGRIESIKQFSQPFDWMVFERPKYLYSGTVTLTGTFDSPESKYFTLRIQSPD
jgi:hypothetical protein